MEPFKGLEKLLNFFFGGFDTSLALILNLGRDSQLDLVNLVDSQGSVDYEFLLHGHLVSLHGNLLVPRASGGSFLEMLGRGDLFGRKSLVACTVIF